MSLSIGIVGLPNVGKSTLFNALTDAGVLAANYPFATIEPNTGVVPIPDPRVEHLASIFRSKRTIPATVTFVDIAGLVRGASEGEGLGNRFLANIRDVNAICHVVRAFDSDNVVHVGSDSDPAGDIGVIEAELALADLETIDKRLPRLEKEAAIDRKPGPSSGVTAQAPRAAWHQGGMISGRADDHAPEFADLHLLTAKPVIYVFNCDVPLARGPGAEIGLVRVGGAGCRTVPRRSTRGRPERAVGGGTPRAAGVRRDRPSPASTR